MQVGATARLSNMPTIMFVADPCKEQIFSSQRFTDFTKSITIIQLLPLVYQLWMSLQRISMEEDMITVIGASLT
jgi:hypothetical protein